MTNKYGYSPGIAFKKNLNVLSLLDLLHFKKFKISNCFANIVHIISLSYLFISLALSNCN